MKYCIALLLFVLVSCQNLPVDNTPAPINNNKMQLEMKSCEKHEVGLLGCFYDEAKVGNLTIPLWSNGEYQIQSERCSYLENKRYEGTQVLALSYAELLKNAPESEKSCLFNVKVFIDRFDNGFEGFFLLEKGDNKKLTFTFKNQTYEGYAGLQLKEGTQVLNTLDFKAETPGLIFWEGCNHNGEKTYQKNPSVKMDEIISGVLIPASSCVLTVGLMPDDGDLPVELGKIHINIFDKTVISLSQPDLEFKKGKLTVRAEKAISGITIGDRLSIETGKAQKKFKAEVGYGKKVIVRLFTANGRFLLLETEDGEILWVK
jgi:hypothetical protein